MQKPILFFSHSSKDREYLSALRAKIIEKTGHSIEIFQSSDGESIPFGNNWVHKIEDNLRNAKIMFVFVSPNSLKSNWLYFESGYSYSKNVRVIPVGINGVDIGQLPPPINLLQGFNLNSRDSLSNFISVINSEFGFSHAPEFSAEEHDYLNSKINGAFLPYSFMHHVDYIEGEYYHNLQNNQLRSNGFQEIIDYLTRDKIKFSTDKDKKIYVHGMIIFKNQEDISTRIDEMSFHTNIRLYNALLGPAYTNPVELYWFYVRFRDEIDILTTHFKISSRLQGLGIEMSNDHADMFRFKTLEFALDDLSQNTFEKKKGKRLRIVYPVRNLQPTEIVELITLLFESQILKQN